MRMATGYHIRRGYNSSHQPDEVESKLRDVVREICSEPERITAEVKRVEGRDVPESFAESYREPWQDLTIKFVEDEDGLMPMQMASGGGGDRDNKEAMRRAVCRMVLERMHAAGMEVSIFVA